MKGWATRDGPEAGQYVQAGRGQRWPSWAPERQENLDSVERRCGARAPRLLWLGSAGTTACLRKSTARRRRTAGADNEGARCPGPAAPGR